MATAAVLPDAPVYPYDLQAAHRIIKDHAQILATFLTEPTLQKQAASWYQTLAALKSVNDVLPYLAQTDAFVAQVQAVQTKTYVGPVYYSLLQHMRQEHTVLQLIVQGQQFATQGDYALEHSQQVIAVLIKLLDPVEENKLSDLMDEADRLQEVRENYQGKEQVLAALQQFKAASVQLGKQIDMGEVKAIAPHLLRDHEEFETNYWIWRLSRQS